MNEFGLNLENNPLNVNYYWRLEMKRSAKKLPKKNKSGEDTFVQNWSPHQPKREYDALQDPHAKYYFFNKCMNQHLKGLKKAIKKDPNQTEKAKLTAKIDNKLSTKLPILKQSTPKTVIYMHQISRSQKELKGHSRKRSLLNSSSNVNSGVLNHSISSIRKQSRQIITQSNQPKISQNQNEKHSKTLVQKPKTQSVDETHIQNHQKFLDFLAKKKSILRYPTQSLKQSDSVQKKTEYESEKQPERYWKQQVKVKQEKGK